MYTDIHTHICVHVYTDVCEYTYKYMYIKQRIRRCESKREQGRVWKGLKG